MPGASRAVTIPPRGYRFDPQKILLDPFAPAVFFPPDYDRHGRRATRARTTAARPLGVLPRTAARQLPI